MAKGGFFLIFTFTPLLRGLVGDENFVLVLTFAHLGRARSMRNFFSFLWEITKIIIIALAIVIPIRYFLFQPFLVRGQSMEPNFENSDYLIIDEVSYRLRSPQRGEVVVFRYPQNPSMRYIKRIVGLPGETITIEDGKIMIFNEEESQIGEENKSSSSPFVAARVLDESNYLPLSVQTPGEIQVSLEKNEYFVLGDNRLYSSDSRRWGPLSEENIIGRVLFRAWPLDALAKFKIPAYE